MTTQQVPTAGAHSNRIRLSPGRVPKQVVVGKDIVSAFGSARFLFAQFARSRMACQAVCTRPGGMVRVISRAALPRALCCREDIVVCGPVHRSTIGRRARWHASSCPHDQKPFAQLACIFYGLLRILSGSHRPAFISLGYVFATLRCCGATYCCCPSSVPSIPWYAFSCKIGGPTNLVGTREVLAAELPSPPGSCRNDARGEVTW